MLAAVCTALVLTLGVFAASPSLHERLHHDTGACDDGCAIVLFANGVSMPLAAPALPPPSADWREQPYLASVEVLRNSPRYLQLPGRGPPAA